MPIWITFSDQFWWENSNFYLLFLSSEIFDLSLCRYFWYFKRWWNLKIYLSIEETLEWNSVFHLGFTPAPKRLLLGSCHKGTHVFRNCISDSWGSFSPSYYFAELQDEVRALQSRRGWKALQNAEKTQNPSSTLQKDNFFLTFTGRSGVELVLMYTALLYASCEKLGGKCCNSMSIPELRAADFIKKMSKKLVVENWAILFILVFWGHWKSKSQSLQVFACYYAGVWPFHFCKRVKEGVFGT